MGGSKVSKAREVFESFKDQYLPFTRSSLAKAAGFSKSLLSPDKHGNYKSKEWAKLATDIAVFIDENSKEHLSQKENLRQQVKNLEQKYQAQIQQNAILAMVEVECKAEVEAYKQAYDTIVEEKTKLEKVIREFSQLTPISTMPSYEKVSPLNNKILISPEEELLQITGGEYNWEPLVLRQAHTFAKVKLKEVLNRPIPKCLYITIGRPGSGKTSWINRHNSHSSRLSVYYDAMNSTFADRWEIMNLARSCVNTTVCFVYFDVEIARCISNNQLMTGKPITVDFIMNTQIDLPDISEMFDKLLIIRQEE